jgi:hypothetical protein
MFILDNSERFYETKIHKIFYSSQQQFHHREETMLSTIDEILLFLKDGRWHNLEEITEKGSISESKVKMIFSFLREYNFVKVNRTERKAKLCPQMINFIDEIQRVQKEEASTHEGFEGTVGIKEFASLRRSFERV